MTALSFPPVEEQLAYLAKGAAEIIREEELRAKLEASRRAGQPLRVYLGVDPTAPDLHLGHTVVIRKLKHFQDLGHTAIFLLGDFSAMIGDPTGQSETRPPLTREEVEANAKTYLDQVFRILDREKTEVRSNSEWLGKLTSYEIVKLCAKYRLARMLEREDFRARLGANQPIAVHELLYPLLTAYDAVMLRSDVELGATEQKFNILVHREIQREYGLAPQVVLTMPILVGLDGQRKMSKSLGNYVGISEPPGEMFGKLMSISDELMWTYWELLTDLPAEGVERLRAQVAAGRPHPMDAKMGLATKIVADFHGEEAAKRAAEEFRRVFRERRQPAEMVEYRIVRATATQVFQYKKRGEIIDTDQYAIPETGREKLAVRLVSWAGVPSRSEAERLIKQGAVEINGHVVEDPAAEIDYNAAGEFVLRVGKRSLPFRVIIE